MLNITISIDTQDIYLYMTPNVHTQQVSCTGHYYPKPFPVSSYDLMVDGLVVITPVPEAKGPSVPDEEPIKDAK